MPLSNVEQTLEQLLPIQAVTFTLEFKQAVTFRFFHETSLMAFIRTIYKIDSITLKETLRIEALESGRVSCNKGDQYRFAYLAFQATQKYSIKSPKHSTSPHSKMLFQTRASLCFKVVLPW